MPTDGDYSKTPDIKILEEIILSSCENKHIFHVILISFNRLRGKKFKFVMKYKKSSLLQAYVK